MLNSTQLRDGCWRDAGFRFESQRMPCFRRVAVHRMRAARDLLSVHVMAHSQDATLIPATRVYSPGHDFIFGDATLIRSHSRCRHVLKSFPLRARRSENFAITANGPVQSRYMRLCRPPIPARSRGSAGNIVASRLCNKGFSCRRLPGNSPGLDPIGKRFFDGMATL